MKCEVVLPRMWEEMRKGRITRWLVEAGERVTRDQPLFEMETDKVDAEIPSPAQGVITILHPAGATLKPDTVVALIESPEAEAPRPGAKRYLNPDDLFPSQQYGFSQVVTSPPGKLVFLSGQVAWDADQRILGPGDLAAQARHALHNVERGLRAAGGEMKDVVSLRIYIVDYSAEKARPVREALQHFFPPDSAPASTWVGVPCLADEEFLIEIEAMAVIEPS